MKRRLRAFGAFWFDFIVGDDWRIAAGVVLGLVATWLVSLTRVPAWWILPAVLLVLVPVRLWRSTRR